MQELKDYCRAQGADVVGIADLAPFKAGWPVIPHGLLDPYSAAVSMALRLDPPIIEALPDRPTQAYAEHYRDINRRLDVIAEGVRDWIQHSGHQAFAIPASAILSEERLMGALSHKAVARMAGIGWQGKSLLIINEDYGPRIRLVTVLTDMPLNADAPVKNRCGACAKCAEACPVQAILNVGTEDRYEVREDALYLDKCNARSFENFAIPEVGARICGLCIQACPWGLKQS